MSLPRLALRHPWTVIVAVVAILLGAWQAKEKMARDIFPTLGIPTIYVAQPYGGMDPLQMEGYLTYYYEYHFLYIAGIEHVESKNIQGASIMKLQFHPGTDMSAALSETIAYVNRARSFMPPGTPGAFVTRFDAGSVPVGNLVFSTENPARTVGQMQDAALNMVRPLFATLPGVSAPPPFGGSARTILINVKPDRLRAYGLSPDDVVAAMTAANTISPSGNLALPNSFPIVPTNAVVKNIQDLAAVPVKVTDQGAVYVRDLGEVSDGSDMMYSIAIVNGRRTVYMPVTKRSDASTLSVVELVKQNLPKFKAACPEDINVTFEFDQSPWIIRAIRDLVKEGILGAALTGLMVLLFLRDLRSAFIVVLNIPIAIAAAMLALWIGGYTINLMTLGGLALAVGILVDEATVEIENIHRHLKMGGGRSLARLVLDASEETIGPRSLSMLCVLAVFVPSFFMTGAAKALFLPLSLAVGFSMIASYLLSSTLVPVLNIWWHREASNRSETVPVALAAASRKISLLFKPSIALRHILVPAYLGGVVFAISILLPFLGTEIFPQIDAGQLQLRLRAPTATRLETTEQIALRTLAIIGEETGPDKVAISMGLVGVHAPNYPVNLIHQWNSGPEEAILQIQLKEGSGAAVAPLREKLRARLAAEFPQVQFSFEPADIVSRVMALGSPTPIEVAVGGKDFAASRAHAELLKSKLAELKDLRDVQFSQTLDYPSVDVQIDRERAGLLGVKMSDATRSLVAATTSSRFTVPNFWADTKTGVSYSLQVQVPQPLMKSLEDLRNVPVTAQNRPPVPLRNIAKVTEGSVIGQYDRYNMARTISITANLQGHPLGSIAKEVEKIIADNPAPAGVSVVLRGQVQPLKELQSGLQTGLLMAIITILLLLVANFQSVRLAFIVLTTIPAALLGVVLALMLTGTTLNLQSFMGAIMSVGVAVANAILLVTFAHRAQLGGMSKRDAALESATTRLRPILMTTLAMIAGMIPMALARSQTSPLAIATIGGLALATVATLLVLPAVYTLLASKTAKPASLEPLES
ncbi:efflux RND transporter permease subunit [Prosthecobacter vanneervenii]|uniref:Multidrug efflux pump subunit AcrB n=1 Tax=Prosthecobacter vanneervenii TaxID=48466 RepID=A0A7W7Y9D3_9BACT|nr:efflux RND transporter permease subunit [Prosthecobacter vanneervenii]MBB5032063.1 multidrug efflux pump subunit AcrB [Prosthecobacter vanneervenii]